MRFFEDFIQQVDKTGNLSKTFLGISFTFFQCSFQFFRNLIKAMACLCRVHLLHSGETC